MGRSRVGLITHACEDSCATPLKQRHCLLESQTLAMRETPSEVSPIQVACPSE